VTVAPKKICGSNAKDAGPPSVRDPHNNVVRTTSRTPGAAGLKRTIAREEETEINVRRNTSGAKLSMISYSVLRSRDDCLLYSIKSEKREKRENSVSFFSFRFRTRTKRHYLP